MSDDVQARQELLKRITSRRASINAYVRDLRPRGTRLTNISIVSSSLAAALTAGPALGGESFANALGQGFSLARNSLVWQVLCFGAMAISIVAAISTNMNKSQETTVRLSTAEACSAELEGLQTLIEFGQLSVQDAVKLYQQYVAKIPFVPEQAGTAA